VPRVCMFYLGICLTTEEKAGKNLSQGSRRVPAYILPKRTRYKTHTYTHTHTLQNNLKQPQYILNEGITMCLKVNKYYTNVRQHNLFIP